MRAERILSLTTIIFSSGSEIVPSAGLKRAPRNTRDCEGSRLLFSRIQESHKLLNGGDDQTTVF